MPTKNHGRIEQIDRIEQFEARAGVERATLYEVQHANRALYGAFLLREELRLLYHLPDPALAPGHLDAWLTWASRSRLRPFVRLARTLREHRDGISPRSASGSPTVASKASTARSA